MEPLYTCPHCQTPLDVAAGPTPQDVVCPHCSALTVIPAIDGAMQLVEAEPTEPKERAREDELSGLRIRQLAAAKRAAYRSRSYCVVAAVACVVMAVQLAWYGVSAIRAGGFGLPAIAYFFVAMLAVWGAVYFFRKAMQFDREAKQSALPAALGEPDFNALSDGSQQWKNLEDVR